MARWQCIDPAAVARARRRGIQLPWGDRQPTRDEFRQWAMAFLLDTCVYIDPRWAHQEAARVLCRAAQEGAPARPPAAVGWEGEEVVAERSGR